MVLRLALRVRATVGDVVTSSAVVARAHRALADREEVVRTVGPRIKVWYEERAILAGYDGV